MLPEILKPRFPKRMLKSDILEPERRIKNIETKKN